MLTIPFVLMILVAGAWLLRSGPAQDEAGVLWRPLLESDRPIMIVLGDYYIFGEYESQYPEVVRLVRDFEVNSPTDLVRLQESDPGRYARTEDMGLNYLPFSSAYGLSAVMPILAGHSRPLRVMPASQVSGDTLRDFNIVYIGLVSGMGQLEQVNFAGSNFSVGENYDELVDNVSTESYLSEEVYSLPSPRYYRDYGYFSTFDEPGGATVMVIAGARDTGLRGMASLVSDPDFNGELEASPEEVDGPGIEAIVEIIGQQGTDLKHRLVAAHNRTSASPGRQ